MGDRPIINEPPAIIIMVAASAAFLPYRSEKIPNTIPPNGRIKKPTAKIAKVANKDAVGSVEGKNCLAKKTANVA